MEGVIVSAEEEVMYCFERCDALDKQHYFCYPSGTSLLFIRLLKEQKDINSAVYECEKY